MQWVTFISPKSPQPQVGLLQDRSIFGLIGSTRLLDLLGDDGERLQRAAERAKAEPQNVWDMDAVRLCAPIPKPPSVRDFYAFEQHVRAGRRGRGLDMDPEWYKLPVFYFSNPASITGMNDSISIPPGSSELDFELEVAAIVGREGSDLSPEEAGRHIAGYCVMNDWSARDLQRREMKLSLGPAKGKDFATTLGPALVTPDELEPYRKGNAYDLVMTAKVNGKEYSRASLADIHWSFAEMLAHASRGTRVVPGDVIGSGTCGTGCILELALTYGTDVYPWLRHGDFVELEVERLGVLRNQILFR